MDKITKVRHRRGASLVFVIIMTVVVFTAGMTMVSTISKAYSSEKDRLEHDQSFRHAYCTMEQVEDSILNGEMGDMLDDVSIDFLSSIPRAAPRPTTVLTTCPVLQV